MISRILKIVVVFFLVVPLVSNAETKVNWKTVNSASANKVRTGLGAFISRQQQSILISSGVNTPQTPYIVENMLNGQSSSDFTIISDDFYLSTQLTTEAGNRPFAASVDFNNATIVAGGIANNQASSLVNLLIWKQHAKTLTSYPLPSLPVAVLSPSIITLNNTLYILTGSDAGNGFYSLDLSKLISAENEFVLNNYELNKAANPLWQKLEDFPLANSQNYYQNGMQLMVQNDGKGRKIYALGGYQLKGAQSHSQTSDTAKHIAFAISPVTQLWKYDPQTNKTTSDWQNKGYISIKKEIINQQINTLSPLGQSHILAFTNEGNALSYNAITNSWTRYNQGNKAETSSSFISTSISSSNQPIYSLNLATNGSGELTLWQAELEQSKHEFGLVNMSVLVAYLLCVVLVGLFFMFKNRNTDDYFRGGQSIPWWAAACSIYATMLSSLTYVALPAVVYQTNWLLLIGIWMIIVVAPIAIYIVMPFFRQINATSAYEYLSKRFNMSVRLFASSLFTLFHIGRMGIVMAITALALSAVTPLSASDSVLIMGVLCLIYCTMGGIEAVIWTDTLQTFVLLAGAITCFITIIMGLDGGFNEFVSVGFSDHKFTMVNVDFSLDSITTLSIWVIVIGGIGQNISSYSADQAVVQRYMVTSNIKEARKSIWANAIMAFPGTLLFFCIGTGLYVFYQVHPEKLDPTIKIDQIFPAFISAELPIGVAGLIVAGIFAAAQSTVSTSMNSIATTLVTDFVKPFKLVTTEKGYMSTARWLTFIMGALGTLAGLIFIDPEIRSLMNAYFKIIGMFMGALGGLFVLGALTKKANSSGAIIGIFAGVLCMISAWQMGWANGYLYATIGIVSCLVFGYLASLLVPGNKSEKDLLGLTLYTMHSSNSNK